MPMPRVMARFNKRVTNKIQGRYAHLMPGYGMVEHTGRTSGRTYRVPLNVFSTDGGFVIALFYGRDSDWARNVLAAHGAQMVHRRKRYVLSNPTFVGGAEARKLVPRPIRLAMRLARVDEVLRLTAVPA